MHESDYIEGERKCRKSTRSRCRQTQMGKAHVQVGSGHTVGKVVVIL